MTGHGLSPERAKEVMAYVWDLRDRMNLHTWRIGLAEDAAPDDSYAAVWIHDDKHAATLYIAPDFLDRDPFEQRRTLVHELIHLVMRNVQEAVTTDLRAAGRLPANIYRPFAERFRRSTEIAVEDLARVIAATMPEVPWAAPEPEAT